MNPEREPADLEGRIDITNQADVVDVRQKVRSLCDSLGFSLSETTRVVTATSELSRNIVEFAGSGEIGWRVLDNPGSGIELIFEDEGPGIEDLEWAMGDGNSTGKGLGKGLPGAKKLTDEMEIDTEPGSGTKITIRKWLNSRQK